MSQRTVEITHRRESRATRLLLWSAVLLGPTLWTTRLLAGFVLATLGCSVWPFGDLALHLLTLILGIIVLLALVGAVVVQRRGARDEVADEVAERVSFMATVGALLSALFLVGLVLQDVPTVVLGACP